MSSGNSSVPEPKLLAPQGNVPVGQGRGGSHSSSSGKVRNRSAAAVQITAEQLIREAREAAEQIDPSLRVSSAAEAMAEDAPVDAEEIADFRAAKRREFEALVRSAAWRVQWWLRYAKWEIKQGDLRRARSVFERALELHPRDDTIWRLYGETEMSAGQPSHARSIYHRATRILPRIDSLWLRWALMEESLGELARARGVFSEWTSTWSPGEDAWRAFVNFEDRHGDDEASGGDRAREVYERFVKDENEISPWVSFARWEEKNGRVSLARGVLERAAVSLGDKANDEAFFVAFAEFEERAGEDERAREIYKCAVETVPRREAALLYRKFIAFEKKRGDRDGIEDVIIGKRRLEYEDTLSKDPTAIDAWFEYARLEESTGDYSRARAVYQRAQKAAIPKTRSDKDPWRRYIYLYLNHAVMEELDVNDPPRARAVFDAAIKAVPHRHFSFSKLWLMYADFEIRQLDVTAARRVLGAAIGMSPKEKIFEHYIEIESHLGHVDRCRKLYNKWIELDSSSAKAWVGLGQLERDLCETERARAVFELAVKRVGMASSARRDDGNANNNDEEQDDDDLLDVDFPEIIWKRYIDAEIEWGNVEAARNLFSRLSEQSSGHLRVWLAWAEFEVKIARDVPRAREVFSKGNAALKDKGKDADEARVVLLRAWDSFENSFGDEESKRKIAEKKPRKVRKDVVDPQTRKRTMREEWVFPEDEGARGGAMKIMEMALKWKKQKLGKA